MWSATMPMYELADSLQTQSRNLYTCDIPQVRTLVEIHLETLEAKEVKIPTWWGDLGLKPMGDSCVGNCVQKQHVSVADT